MAAEALVFMAGALCVTLVGSSFVSCYMARFAAELREGRQSQEQGDVRQGFTDGGKVIGLLERFLIYLFVLGGRIEGVGFLVAAKSVFRFGELSNPQHRLEAEYITIGTLMSFAWGLAASLLTKLALEAM